MPRRQMERELEALHGSCLGWAMTCCGWNRDEAEEVLQAAYLKALDGRARFGERSSLKSWFFGVVKRTAAERRRRRRVRSLGLDRWIARAAERPPVSTPERLSSDAEDRRRLRHLLGQLTTRQRDLLHLVFYEGMTIESAADVLSISLGTARTHYERGKSRMRDLLMRTENHHETARRDRAEASRTVCGGQAAGRAGGLDLS